ncbi:MAG: T9SS type A sorting domain-containing protein [Flavobacteriales bacterium]|nr:T9SS type A sorting domain-containing protein [Flavobacteriales bacterium]
MRPAGRTVWQQDVAAFSGTRKENIHLSTLSAGTYMLHLRTNEGLRTERLVIQ